MALGGGAARALAHVGVVGTLRRNGIEVVSYAGTSAGALVAAMFALGRDEKEILERFNAFTKTRLYKDMKRSFLSFRRDSKGSRASEKYFRQSSLALVSEMKICAVNGELYQAFIEFFVGGDRDISSLESPFCACATDLVEGRPVTLMHGSLHVALRASCAVPGIFPPEVDGPRLMVDGAATSEVPVSAARQISGQNPVLAVYLERPEYRVTTFANSEEIAIRSNALVHTELVREQLRQAPLLVRVPVGEIGWLDFRKAEATALLGQISAEKAMPQLVRDLRGGLVAAQLAVNGS
jgi:NTE family protein